jgi:hypothetical protein
MTPLLRSRSLPTARTSPPGPAGPPDRGHRALALVGVLAGLSLPACGERERTFEITDVRTIASPGPAAPRGVEADFSRFGYERRSDDEGRERTAPAARRWSFETPEGWTELPPGPMRDHGWRVGGDPKAECTLSFLEGAGGGLAANVDRWRRQMSLEPAGDDGTESLPKRPWLGVEATLVDLRGDYRGMGSTTQVAQARLLGLVAALPSGTAFLKLTGLAETVAAEEARFLALADSIRLVPPPDGPREGADRSPPSRAPLAWTVPEGWVEQPPKPMRLVTFSPRASPRVSVHVSVLAGAGGGLRLNLDRWYAEMGRPTPTDEEVAALPRGTVLGKEAVYVEVEGAFQGMGDAKAAPGSLLLAMMVVRERDSVFVKMTGPADEVRAERERFRAFCESLR